MLYYEICGSHGGENIDVVLLGKTSMLLFWATTPRGLVDEYLCFRKKHCLYLHV
jgi:hypothetical protein